MTGNEMYNRWLLTKEDLVAIDEKDMGRLILEAENKAKSVFNDNLK